MADFVNRTVAELKSAKTDDQRLRAARRLRDYVRVQTRAAGNSNAGFNAALNTLYAKVFELLNSPDNNDKLGGIFALYELTDEPVPDNETKLARFANYLKVVHGTATDPVFLRLCAKTLGHLARAGGTMTAEFVEHEIRRPLEWLQNAEPRVEHRRLAAVYILRELADAAPSTVHAYATKILSCLWTALSDSKVQIREAAAKALASCLAVVASRRGRARDQMYASLFNTARAALAGGGGSSMSATSMGMAMGSMGLGSFGFGMGGSSSGSGVWADAVHGALLTLAELLASPSAAPFCAPRFNDVCELVLRHRDSRDRLVRRTVLALLPRLAHFNPEAFVRAYAEISLSHLLSCLRDPKAPVLERGTAYLAVGRIALAVGGALSGDALRPQLERIVAVLREGLVMSSSTSSSSSTYEGKSRGGMGMGSGSGVGGAGGGGRSNAARVAGGAGLAGAGGGRTGVALEAMACVAMLARAVGPALTEYAHELIDPMFRASMSTDAYSGPGSAGAGEGGGMDGPASAEGLSVALTEALAAIGDAIPALRPLLQERLLHELSLLLAGRPFVPPYAEPYECGPGGGRELGGYPGQDWNTGGPGEEAGAAGLAAQMPVGLLYSETSNGYGLLPPSLSGLAGTPSSLGILSAVLASGGAPPVRQGRGMEVGQGQTDRGGTGGVSGALAGPGSHSHGSTRPGPGPGVPSTASIPFTFGWARSLAAHASGYAQESRYAPEGSGGYGGSGQGGAPSAGGGGHPLPYHDWATGRPCTGALVGLYGPVTLARARSVPTPSVCLALHTLGSFDFSGIPLLPFLREVVLLYLDDSDPSVRLEASLTCTRLLVRPTELSGNGMDGADADPLLAAALFDAEAELAADVAASGEGEDEDIRRARAAAGQGQEDEDEDDVIGVDVLGPVALLRAAGRGGSGRYRTATNSHTLAALSGSQSGASGGTGVAIHGDLDAALLGDAAARRGGQGVATLWGDARSVPDVNPVAATLSSSYDTRRRHTAFRARYVRVMRPPSHPLLVWGIDASSMGGLAGSGLVYSRPKRDTMGMGGSDTHGCGRGEGGGGEPGSGYGAGSRYPPNGNEHANRNETRFNCGVGPSTSNLLGALTAVVGPGPTLLIISQILQRLLVVAIADPDPVIRFEVLCALDSRFDPLLVEDITLRLLSQGLSDENYAVREAVLALLGRLVAQNPASILPSLRITLMSVLAELQFVDAHPDVSSLDGSNGGALVMAGTSGYDAHAHGYARLLLPGSGYGDWQGEGGTGLPAPSPHASRGGSSDIVLSAAADAGPLAGREHASRMLALVVRASQRLVLPYIPVVLRALLPQTWATAPGRSLGIGDMAHPLQPGPAYYASAIRPEVLSTCALAALGEISAVGADAFLPHMHVLVPLVVDGLTSAAHAMGLGPGPAAMGSTSAGASIEGLEPVEDLTGSAADSEPVGEGSGGMGPPTGVSGGRRKIGMRGGGPHLVLGASGAVSTVPPVRLAPGTNALLFATVAVRTLGLLVENTGQVVMPYMDHPHLLGLLLTLLARAPSTSSPVGPGSSASPSSSAPTIGESGEGGRTVPVEDEQGGNGERGESAVGDEGGEGASPARHDPAGPSSSASALFAAGSGGGWNLRREILRTLGILGALDPYRYRMTLLAQAKRSTQAVQAVMQARLSAAVASARAAGRLITTAGLTPDSLARGVRAGEGAAILLLGALGERDGGEDMGVGVAGKSGFPKQVQGQGQYSLLLPDGQGAWTGVAAAGADSSGAGGGGTPWDLMWSVPPIIGLALGGGMASDPMEAALAGLAGEPGSSVGVNLDEVGMAVGLGMGYTHGRGGGLGFGGNLDVMIGREGGLGLGLAGDPLLAMLGGCGWGGPGMPGQGGGMGMLVGVGVGGQGIAGGVGGVELDTGYDAGGGAGAGEPASARGRHALGPLGALAGIPASSLLPAMVPSPEDFAPSVALLALLEVLADDALAVHHPAALAAVTAVLRSLGSRCVPYISRVFSALLGLLRASLSKGAKGRSLSGSGGVGEDGGGGALPAVSGGAAALARAGMSGYGAGDDSSHHMMDGGTGGDGGQLGLRDSLREAVLAQISALLLMVRHGLRPWLPTLFTLIRDMWPGGDALPALLSVVEATGAALGDTARPYLATLVPHFLSVLAHDGCRPVATPSPAAETYMRDAGYECVVMASGYGEGGYGDGSGSGSGGIGRSSDGSLGGGSGATGGTPTPPGQGGAGGGPTHPSPARLNTRYVLHTIAVLAAGGRRPLVGGHRRLLDDHYPLLVPAIARLMDAGVGVAGAAGVVGAALASPNAGAGGVGVGGGPGGGAGPHPETGPLSEDGGGGVRAGGHTFTPPAFAPSNSSSLAGHGAVLPAVRRQAIDTLSILAAAGVNLSPFSARIIQPLARVLSDTSLVYTPPDLRSGALDCLSLLLIQMREEFVPWIPTIRRACSLGSMAMYHASSTTHGEHGTTGHGPGASQGAEVPPCGIGWGGVSGAGLGAASALRHDAFDRLVCMLLGMGGAMCSPGGVEGGCGPEGSSMALYGYGPSPLLPSNPVHLAALLCDPGTCSADGTGARLAAALSLTTGGGGGDGDMDGMVHSAPPGRRQLGQSVGLGAEGGGLLGVLGGEGQADAWGLGLGIGGKVAAAAAALGGTTRYSLLEGETGSGATGMGMPAGGKKLPINPEALKRIWDSSSLTTKEEWLEWIRRFGLELLRESPSSALRATCSLAQVLPALANDLFNAAFVAVWGELYGEYQDSLAASLEAAFNSPFAPTSVLRTLLGVVEFMERDDRQTQMPISTHKMGMMAEKVGSYAKALHYREEEYVSAYSGPSGSGQGRGGSGLVEGGGTEEEGGQRGTAPPPSSSLIVEQLISINNQLDQPEAAVGILKFAMQVAAGVAHYGYRASHIIGPGGGEVATGSNGRAFDDISPGPGAAGGGGGGRLAGLPVGMDDGPMANARAAKVAALALAADADRTARGGRGGVGVGASAAAGQGQALARQQAVSHGHKHGPGLDISETWYEKLGRWEDALEAYERKQGEMPNSLAVILGSMRCLKALGEWGRLEGLCRSAWPRLEGNPQGRAAVAPLAARAAWALGRWADMEVYLRFTDSGSLQGAFFRAVLATHALDFHGAARHIDRARRVLSHEIAGIMSLGEEVDTFGKCYRRLVTAQQLAEIEESVTYLRLASAGNSAGAAAYMAHIRNVWRVRMRGVARNVDVWHRLLSVRSLVTLAPDNLTEWLQFASLARRSGRHGMALRVLLGLGLGTDPDAVRAISSRAIPSPAPQDGAPTVAQSIQTAAPGGVGSGRPGIEELPHGSGPDPFAPGGGADEATSSAQAVHDTVLEAAVRVGAESRAHPRVMYAYLKHVWHSGHRDPALAQLRKLTAALDASAAARVAAEAGHSLIHPTTGAAVQPGVFGKHVLDPADENALRVQCHLRSGQWQEAALEPVVAGYSMDKAGTGVSDRPGPDGVQGVSVKGPDPRPTPIVGPLPVRMPSAAYEALVGPVLASFRTATHHCGERGNGHYRAWHAWAIANFVVAEYHAENLRTDGGRTWAKGLGGAPGESGPESKAPLSGRDKGAGPGTPNKSALAASARAYGISALAGVEEELEEEDEEEGVGMMLEQGAAVQPKPHTGPARGFPIKAAITAHAVAAVKAFFRSIALGRTRLKAYILQDLLRLLTLMFKYAESPPVRLAVEAGMGTGAISTDVWLQVVPQLIARLHIPNPSVKKLLTGLMSRIGTSHPQSLIYPLTVTVKSGFKPRRDAAAGILGVLRRVHARLCDEADVVSRELIRVAILWHEQWHAGLEDASRAYFGEGNTAAMLAILLPLHDMMSRPGPETARELAFVQAYGRELESAHKWVKSYQSSGRVTDLTAAWELYYTVFRKINKTLPSITVLDLQSCSPRLLQAHDLSLSVPGTYTVGTPVVRLASVCPAIAVIASKQRPRRITLAGSDGRRYSFLLKGHEDLRQDERVMQLFGLANTLLTNDGDTAKRDLAIRRYAVTPLSHAAGVVGWVPGCDTLHALIREYRDAKKLLLNIEHRLMVQMSPPYDHCTVLQKVETFRYALDNTLGHDLAKVLWLKSASAEAWLARRTAYARSLAVMSMVGYVLGLGDRHPSNLMLDRGSGKILHIDFGDCFETAVTRDKFPERVPFRLTRMLVAAMEVAGVEGAFRSVAEAVMRVLRANRDSVMALLEAFVHDPLINWRLLATNAAVAVVPGVGQAAPGGGAVTAQYSDDKGGAAAGSAAPAGKLPDAAAKAGSFGKIPEPVPAAAAGVAKLVETSEQAAVFIAQGLTFQAEIDAGLLASAIAETGIPLRGGDGKGRGDPDAQATAAIARSIAATYATVRGGEKVRGADRAALAMANQAAAGLGLEPEPAAGAGPGLDADSEALNERAVAVIRRIFAKLTGRDFGEGDRIGALMSVGVGLAPGAEQAMSAGRAGAAAGVQGGGGLAALNLGLAFGGVQGGGGGSGGAGPGTALSLSGGMDVPTQVHRLILAAMSVENLAQAYVGWCPFW